MRRPSLGSICAQWRASGLDEIERLLTRPKRTAQDRVSGNGRRKLTVGMKARLTAELDEFDRNRVTLPKLKFMDARVGD